MSVSIVTLETEFFLPRVHAREAHQALIDLALTAQESEDGRLDYDVDQDILEAPNLIEALAACRWQATVTRGGDIVNLVWEGESMGDDEGIFAALAPYVAAGSHIDMIVNDEEFTRFYFDGTQLHVIPGTVTFPAPEGTTWDAIAQTLQAAKETGRVLF